MRISAVQHMLEVLKKEIQSQYSPGDILPNERELAERFDVSRNTVREALIFLEAYQLIEKTQRGPRVREPGFEPMFHIVSDAFSPTSKTAQDVLRFRRVVEYGVLPDVIINVTDADITNMEAAIARMDRAHTVREAAQADHDFHAAMLHASDNKVFQQLYKVMAATLVYYLEIGKSDSAHNATASAQHRRIVDALRARSLERLQDAVREHFEHSECVRESTQPLETLA